MARTQLKDLPKDMKISSEEMRKVRGGVLMKPTTLSLYSGVEGESSDANHDKWIDILSVDWK